MEFDIVVNFLLTHPAFDLFLILGCGYLFGRVSILGFQPGAVAGVLFVSLFFGRLGYQIAPGAQAVGFALFIFSVGYQAGPHFVDVVRTDGLRYLILAGVVAACGCSVALCAGYLVGLPPGAAAGVLSGGLTSSPTLAAAQEAVRSGLVTTPPGMTSEEILQNIGSAYAITYIFGLAGLILVIGVLPKILKIDLAAEARQLEAGMTNSSSIRPQLRAYRVSKQESCQPTIGQLRDQVWDGLSIIKLRRGGVEIPFDFDAHLDLGDELIALGDHEVFMQGLSQLGEEIPVAKELELAETSATLIVSQKEVVGKQLGKLKLAEEYGLLVTGVARDNYSLPVTQDLELQRGDIITVVGQLEGVEKVQGVVGPVETDVVATDMLIFAFGIAFGLLIGQVSFSVAGIPLGLGMAGGLLTAGIVVGMINSSRPNIGKFPAAARWVFMEFGLLIFIAAVGARVGGSIVETLMESGFQLVIAGVFTTMIPLIAGYVVGRWVLKLSPVILFGALAGALTSGAALSIVTRESKSSAPALGYTGTYAFANIILSIAGTLMVLL